MKLHELQNTVPRQARKRVGRGDGSGTGRTAGRGEKGAGARTGHTNRPYFEGGQIPLIRRLPKRGFKNYLFKVTYEVINLVRLLAAFPDQKEITLEDIYSRGLVKSALVKILGEGEVTRPVSIEAFRFSQSAKDKILAAGGEVKELLADAEEPATSEE